MANKRIILLSDGTGNSAGKVWRTNVWRVFESLDLTSSQQIAFYDDGVGTSSFKPFAILGGAFGFGLKRNVLDIYKFACRNYRSHLDYLALEAAAAKAEKRAGEIRPLPERRHLCIRVQPRCLHHPRGERTDMRTGAGELPDRRGARSKGRRGLPGASGGNVQIAISDRMGVSTSCATSSFPPSTTRPSARSITSPSSVSGIPLPPTAFRSTR